MRTQKDRDEDLALGRELERKDAEIERLQAVILNIQSLAEKGFPIDSAKLARRCRMAIGVEQKEPL